MSDEQSPANPPRTKSRRGFAAMDPERQRQIAGAGGRAAHAMGLAHQFTSEEARAAGSKRHRRNDSQTSSGDNAA